MNTLILTLIFGILVLILLGFIFWGIFKSNKTTTKYYHRSRMFGENYFEQSD